MGGCGCWEDIGCDAEGGAEVCVFRTEDGELEGCLEFVGFVGVRDEVVEEVESAHAIEDVVRGTEHDVTADGFGIGGWRRGRSYDKESGELGSGRIGVAPLESGDV